MSGIRMTCVALAAVLAGAAAAPVLAQSSPAVPTYLFQLPERQWILGGTLSEAGSRCGRERCEAGYRSGDLVLSVRRGGTDVQAVAAMRGCANVSARTLSGETLTALSPADQYTRIQNATLAAARTARTQCASPVADIIDTAPLVNVAPGLAPRS